MNDLTNVNFSMNLTEIDEWAKFGFSQTDLVRLKAGRVKAQVFVLNLSIAFQCKSYIFTFFTYTVLGGES